MRGEEKIMGAVEIYCKGELSHKEIITAVEKIHL